MRIRFQHLVVASATAAMVGAPAAVADDSGQSCTDITSTATECSSPGNVEINDAPPVDAGPDAGGAYPGPYPVPFDEGSR
jgi:hypothetical protein